MTLDLLLDQYEMIYRHFLNLSIEVKKMHKLPNHREDVERLRQIPGIGPLSSVQLLIEIENIKRFKNTNHFNGYLGLKPMVYISGERNHKYYVTYRGKHTLW